MKKALTIASYTVGGATLLAGSFFLFAAMSGTPLSDVGGVGDMFPEEADGTVTVDQSVPDVEEELATDRRGREQVFLEAASPLRAFVLDSPFSTSELELLEKRLESRMEELHRRELEVAQREAAVEADRKHYEELYDQLETLRSQLVAERDELITQRAEAERDAMALDEKQQAAWRAVSALFEEGKANTQAQMLIDGYSPKEVGFVLAGLETQRVSELLTAVHKIDPAKYEAFEKAWRAVIR